ncbi:MAG: tetraacyldisaccharide 4'-kinase, partial [Cyclobacteriaceae bacterium]|nr:tetraacyldisaccharide 4'-kinase [Cyclobacteriaceae bacterium]
RRLRPGFSILLTDYSRPFYRDYLMPSGRLRESRKGASRAHVVVVTKCPDNLDEKNMNHIRELVQQYTRAPVYFTSLQYDEPHPLHATKSCLNNKVVLVTGVARPEPLEQWVRNRFSLLRHFRYRDHHHYSVDDLLRIKKFTEQFAEPVSVITTEKDAVKLTALPGYEALSLFAVPVTVRFLNNGKEFDNLVLNYALGRAS